MPSQHQRPNSFIMQLRAVQRLSRWRQHVPYTIPLVLIGALMATRTADTVPDWRLLTIMLANILAMTFAFMINDVVDAQDDALDAVKARKNVISQGLLTQSQAYSITVAVVICALILYSLSGWPAGLAGIVIVALSFAYSVPPLRWKARPVLDVVSHVLMLSTLLMLSGYWVYYTPVGSAVWVLLAITSASAYGQFYNQLDDFIVDQQAGLRNTAMWLGEQGTRYALLISGALTVLCLLVAIGQNLFPIGLLWVGLVTAFTLTLFEWDQDMRGNVSDASGQIQRPILITLNIVALIWLLAQWGLLGIG
ncbi:MAG: prenyltransferase [Anaerolineae bacterium]